MSGLGRAASSRTTADRAALHNRLAGVVKAILYLASAGCARTRLPNGVPDETTLVHGANIQDRDGANGVLKRSRARYPFIKRTYANGGYAGRLVTWPRDKTHIVLEIVRRNATAKGFEVLPRRWVVERTFAWIMKNRRFARDYEQLTSVAETLIVIAACATLVRRWP